jgi:hypothetical protein
MSKAVKQIVSVAAMIAIPYFAPIIAGSAGLAGVTAAIGSTATSALVGAGLGAAKGAVLGEDIGRSALMGGIGGGVAGYAAAPTATSGTGLAASAPTASAGSQYALTGTGGTGLQMGASSAPGLSLGGTQAVGTGAAEAGLAGGFGAADYSIASAAPAGAATPAGMGSSYNINTASAMNAPGAGELSMTGAPVRPFTEYFGSAAAPTAGTAGAPRTFSQILSQTGNAIKAKFADPKNLADLTLRAAGQLAGSALAGSGLSPEEEALLSQQTEELRQLQQTNQALFNQRLEQAQNLAGESKYFDPEYFGLQSARRAQTAGAVAKRAGLRGLTGDRREAEARRYDIESGRRTGTAYDTGFMSAISPRVQTQQAGLAAMPTSGPSVNYAGLQGAYNTAATRQRQTQADIGDLFGTLTSNPRSRG